MFPVSRRRSTRVVRRGLATAELAFALPILLIVLMAIFEFSLLFLARGEVVEASREGARVASLPGATWESVEGAVQQSLTPRLRQSVRIDISGGERAGDVTSVTVLVPMHLASPDLLWPIGYSLKGRTLIAESRMMRE